MSEETQQIKPTKIISRKQYWLLIGIILAFGIFWNFWKTPIPQDNEPLNVEERVYHLPVMGTNSSTILYGESSYADTAAQSVRLVFKRVERVANLYDSESELSQLNNFADNEPFVCSDTLWEMLQVSRVAYEKSDGSFDISTKPLMDLWGFYQKKDPDSVPSDYEINQTLKRVGLDKVFFDDELKSVFFKVSGMALDLGGVAKGYAVDKAVDAAISLGIKQGMVALGGNIRTFSEPPPGKKFYTVSIRDPFNPEDVLDEKIKLCGNSVASSGNYQKYVKIDSARYAHIMDVKTGYPLESLIATTVVAPLALDADILSMMIFIKGEKWIENNKNILPLNSDVYCIGKDEIKKISR